MIANVEKPADIAPELERLHVMCFGMESEYRPLHATFLDELASQIDKAGQNSTNACPSCALREILRNIIHDDQNASDVAGKVMNTAIAWSPESTQAFAKSLTTSGASVERTAEQWDLFLWNVCRFQPLDDLEHPERKRLPSDHKKKETSTKSSPVIDNRSLDCEKATSRHLHHREWRSYHEWRRSYEVITVNKQDRNGNPISYDLTKSIVRCLACKEVSFATPLYNEPEEDTNTDESDS